MKKRVILLLLDSVGCGYSEDAVAYGDVGSNTIGNIAKELGGLNMPNFGDLGLGNILPLDGVPASQNPQAAYGKMREVSAGKDTTAGHWEIAGTPLFSPRPTYPEGFPADLIADFEALIGKKTIANVVGSGTAIIDQFAAEHIATGSPIVYTSADSVFQIAAHEEVIPLAELYEICQKARTLLQGKHGVGRVIARPFIGENGVYTRTASRRDYSLLPPANNLLETLQSAQIPVVAVGKIHDIFADQNIDFTYTTKSNDEGFATTLMAMDKHESGFIWTNLVDFDMAYGHRNDVAGYGKALEVLDVQLPEILEKMAEDDILFVTADHGNDPTTESTDHSREFVPLLAYGKNVKPVNLEIRGSFADLGQTIVEYLADKKLPHGESFLNLIK